MAEDQNLIVREEVEDRLNFQPMSPSSQCINTSFLSLSIIAVVHSEIPIDESKVVESLKKYLLQVNSHFSSVVVTDKKGAQWWKKVEFGVEDHVIVPSFAPDLSNEAYAELFKEYLSKLAVEKLNEKRPLWEIHVFKYPTCDAAGILALKMHHALGDGFSLMGALFSCLKRADNPSLPLTFPSSTAHPSSPRMRGEMKVWKSMSSFVSGFWNTASDFVWGILQSTLLENDRTVIRSGKPGIKQMPMDITSVTFSLGDIRQIKIMLGASVNDVVVGIVFYSIQLYAHAMGESSTNLRRTALVLLNTRMVNGYQGLDDMLEKDLWGNHFSFIHLSVPSQNYGKKIDPLQYIFKAQKVVKRNRNSIGIYLNGILLQLVGKLGGFEAISKYVHSTLRNSSMCISNIVGPVEKMTLAEHPVNNIYFFVTGSPQDKFEYFKAKGYNLIDCKVGKCKKTSLAKGSESDTNKRATVTSNDGYKPALLVVATDSSRHDRGWVFDSGVKLHETQKIGNLDRKIVVTVFTSALHIGSKVHEKLTLHKPRTVTEMIDVVNNYIELERSKKDKMKSSSVIHSREATSTPSLRAVTTARPKPHAKNTDNIQGKEGKSH
ncbi:hypothetical protein GIB67_003074 [Kingdonia uniflora]|uniref:Diacylglycerol O-acyltransferase n=1 Tax=Kingdonia uniflora TaxID=39325 RepID=A0A7J7N6K5_9MAGN|nr:hypothetical protein GIB67_003074 [Kingdonia uniflora]